MADDATNDPGAASVDVVAIGVAMPAGAALGAAVGRLAGMAWDGGWLRPAEGALYLGLGLGAVLLAGRPLRRLAGLPLCIRLAALGEAACLVGANLVRDGDRAPAGAHAASLAAMGAGILLLGVGGWSTWRLAERAMARARDAHPAPRRPGDGEGAGC